MLTRLILAGWVVVVLAPGQVLQNAPAIKINDPKAVKGSDPAADLIRTGRIEGVVLDDRYLRPLRRGYVVLKPLGAGRTLSGETDETGKFSIEAVDAGQYTVEARRDGYLNANFARRGGIRMPRVFTLLAGQELRDLTFRLEPWAALEGKIRFEDGEPAFGVPVILYRKDYARGLLRYLPVGSTRTNDRGEYRLAGLAPGAYIIAAIYNKPVKPKRPDDSSQEAPDSEWSYATTYYTSGQRLSDAIPVKLESGRELTGLDIFLGLVRAVRVKLRVTDSCAGGLSSKAVVQLYRMDENGNPAVPVNADIDGREGEFVVRGLGPGSYLVVASSDGPKSPVAAAPACAGTLRDRRIVAVSDYPIDGLEMSLRPPLLARFGVSTDDAKAVNSDLASFDFHLEPRSGLPGGNVMLEKQRYASNVLAGLVDSQEEYDLILDRKPPDAYLKGPLQLTEGRGIRVGLRGAQLYGSVVNEMATRTRVPHRTPPPPHTSRSRSLPPTRAAPP